MVNSDGFNRVQRVCFSGVLFHVLLLAISLRIAVTLTCIKCEGAANDNHDCWRPSPQPKTLVECNTSACTTQIVFLSPRLLDSVAIPISIHRDCADLSDSVRSVFLGIQTIEMAKGDTNTVICRELPSPCRALCYCGVNNCNKWTTDKVQDLPNQLYLKRDKCEPYFARRSNFTSDEPSDSAAHRPSPPQILECAFAISLLFSFLLKALY